MRGPEVFICVEPFREQTPQPPEPDCAREEYATSYGLITGLVNERTLTVTLNGVVLPDGEEIYDAGLIVIGMRNGDFYWAFVQIPDVDGTYPFTAVAWDALGNYRDATAYFIRDTVPPDINITDPLDGIVVNTPTVTITGVVDDPEALVYEGYYGPLIPVVDGVFEVEVALDEGPNGFIFQAEDAAGNQGSATVRITLDTIPPQIDITSPVEGGAMNTVNLAVSGLVIDENINTVTVSANGESPQPLTITGQGFSGTVALSSGWNTLLFEATDQVGNAVQQTRAVLLDMLSPTVAITLPTSGASVSGLIQVTVEASDLQSGVSGVSLLLDGQLYSTTTQSPYTFDLDTMAYAAGVHTLTARATDTAGNISEASTDL
ncbi:MAG: Ig-like domain-containing protein, partial [Planctomycetes bacterium]|nr:Ig-like domain-containing protein [Planctomycetota bacterium]